MLWEGKVISMRRGKSHQVMNKVRGRWEGICVKCISTHFSLPIFFPIWEDKKSKPRRENFLPYFLSLLFSFINQTVENSIFYPIFFFLFFILPVFTPTKHTLRLSAFQLLQDSRKLGLKDIFTPRELKTQTSIQVSELKVKDLRGVLKLMQLHKNLRKMAEKSNK